MSHRRRPKPRRRGRYITVGVLVVASMVGAGLAFSALGGSGDSGAKPSQSSSAERSPMSVGLAERDSVPEACEVVSAGLAGKLVPGADGGSVAQGSERHSECAWNRPDAAKRSRLLNVELRALDAEGNESATAVATRTYNAERVTDTTGDRLAESAKVGEKRSVRGLGDTGYAVYVADSDKGDGMAIVNVQRANLLITVRFSGCDTKGGKNAPLSTSPAIDGAISVVKDVVDRLGAE